MDISRRRAALAVVAGVLAFSVSWSAGPAMAYGTSITSPGAAASLGMTEAEYAAYIGEGLGEASMYANAGATAVGTVEVTAGATATGASTSIAGDVAGKLVVLLGGLGAWRFVAPDAGEPGLPPSSSGAITLTAQGYWSFESLGATSLNGGTGLWQWSGLKHVVRTGNSTTVNVKVYCKATDLTPVTAQQSQPNETGTLAAAWTGPDIVSRTATTGFGVAACPVGTYPQLARLMGNNAFDTPVYTWAHAPMPGEGVPDRHIEQTITCKDAAGQTQTVTNSTAAAPWSAGQVVEVAGLMCPDGSRAVGVEAVVKTTGGDDLAVVSSPYESGAGLDAGTSWMPEACYTAAQGCTVDLERATNPERSEWEQVDPASVPGWWTDPLRDEIYRCTYGGVVIGMAACSVYRNAPGPVELVAEPVADNDPSGDCEFGWSDLLTGGIFLRGGKCLLRWAFVPATGFWEAQVGSVQAAWNGTAPVVLVDAVGSVWQPWVQQRTAPTSCEGPEFYVEGMMAEHSHPLSACGELAQQVVPVGKALISAVVVVSTLIGAGRQIVRAFGLEIEDGARGAL